MTPEERQRVDELFDRLAKLETTPRDKDASRAIAEGLERAPNAIYPLVQTVLIQDEALKRADARIRELSGEAEAPTGGGFLDSMRNALTGGAARGSVPSVHPNEPDRRWNSGGAFNQAAPPLQQAAAPQPSQGGSFLGTAAASAAGMIGGALLLNSFSSMFGHRGGSAFADTPSSSPSSESPWSGNAANSDLARDAGVNDIGRGSSGAGLLDTDQDVGDQAGLSGDIGSDFGGDSGGGDSA
jgi:hypothetical protein